VKHIPDMSQRRSLGLGLDQTRPQLEGRGVLESSRLTKPTPEVMSQTDRFIRDRGVRIRNFSFLFLRG